MPGYERVTSLQKTGKVRLLFMMSERQSTGQPVPQPPTPKDYDEHMTWRIRWYLIIAITIAYALALIGGLIGFWIAKDPRYFLFIAPTALIPFVRYLVPMDKKRYELELAKINAKKELHEARVHIQMLERELEKQLALTSTPSRSEKQE